MLRPLAFGEILDTAFSVLRRNVWVFLAISVIPSAIGAAALGVLTAALPQQDGKITADDLNAVLGGGAVSLLIVLLTSQLATGALFKAVVDTYIGGTASIGEALRFALRRLPSMLWIALLTGFGLLFGFILLIIPGIILWAMWSLALPVLMSEDTRGTKALSRSAHLVKGRWWGTLGLMVVTFVIATIFSSVIGRAIGAAIGTSGSGSLQRGLSTFVETLISSTLTGPLVAAVTTVLYIDQRVRKEGLDVQLLAMQAAAEEPAGA